MTKFKTALALTALLTLAIPTVAQARITPGALGFSGHKARAGVIKAYQKRGYSTSRLRVSALRVTRTGKTRIFKVTNRNTGESRLAMQSVKTLKIRLTKLIVPNKAPATQPTPVVQPKPVAKPTPVRTTGTVRGGYNAETYSRALTGGLIRSSYSPSGRHGYRSIP